MKHLYFLCSVYTSEDFAFEIDSIITDSKINDVAVLVCDESHTCCFGNTYGVCLLCNECRKRTYAVLNSIKNIRIIKSGDYIDDNVKFAEYNYKSIRELNSVIYKNVEIGYGVSSCYISLTRNLNPKMTKKLKNKLDEWLNCSMRKTDIAEKLITNDYDKVYVVSGRTFDTKPFQEVAANRGIHFVMVESAKNISGQCVRMYFDNIKVHSISGNTENIISFWNKSPLALEERRKIASSFFEKRANAIMTNDKIYVKNQKKGLLPEGWSESKTNIVIFNSSEDECAAIGGEFVKNALFESQLEGINYILENVKDSSYHFYLRIHPNLMYIPYKYHKDLYKLETKFNNLTVISCDSPVSSYSLMEYCNRIITFGSTMGVESAYAGKQVMLLRPCLYYYLDVCFVPQNHHEILDFIHGRINFTPNHENTLKFSYYYFNNDRETVHNKECEIVVKKVRFGNKAISYGSMNLMCSNLRMRYFSLLRLLGRVYAKRFLPKEEM